MRCVVSVMTCVLGLAVMAATARADAAGDVEKAFAAFVARATSGKPDLGGVDVFLGPSPQDGALPDDDGWKTLRAVLPAPKISGVKVVVSKAGTSAWLVADLSARTYRDDKLRDDSVRASAVLALGPSGWQVRAAHWSVAKPNQPYPSCGNMDTWHGFEPSVAKDLVAPVKAVVDAMSLASSLAKYAAWLSDDSAAIMIGSGPRERWAGPAIKKLFRKLTPMWADSGDGEALRARAGTTPDGELLWIVLPVLSHHYCTYYRTLLVLHKEGSGWKVVHQHYSEGYFSLKD